MSIWKTIPTCQEPEINLCRWTVYEVGYGDNTLKTLHFVGYEIGGRCGRVSSAIQEFDTQTLQGRTRSGRVYKLSGPVGHDRDAAYVWNQWCTINGVETCEEVDIHSKDFNPAV